MRSGGNGLREEKDLGVVVRGLEMFERGDLARGRWVHHGSEGVFQVGRALIVDRSDQRSGCPLEVSERQRGSRRAQDILYFKTRWRARTGIYPGKGYHSDI